MGILADARDQHDFTDLYSSTRRSSQRRSKIDAKKGYRMTKSSKLSVRTAKTQISPGIRPVQSESSLFAWRNLSSYATHWGGHRRGDGGGGGGGVLSPVSRIPEIILKSIPKEGLPSLNPLRPYKSGAKYLMNSGLVVLGRVLCGASCLGASCLWGELSCFQYELRYVRILHQTFEAPRLIRELLLVIKIYME